MVRAMTTLKPQLVRADTLDLQDHNTPSAKDHSRQPTHPSPYGYGPAAPHQAQTLRLAEQDAYQQQHPNSRASEDNGAGTTSFSYGDSEDDPSDDRLHTQHDQNGTTYHGQDMDEGESGDSHDEDMDDDMLDKISSSPSIDDGKYSLPAWPPRADSVNYGASPASLSSIARDIPSSSSPFSSAPEHFSLGLSQPFVSPASHLGEYGTGLLEAPTSHQVPRERLRTDSENDLGPSHTCIPLSESQEFRRYLLPLDDPLLLADIDQSTNGPNHDQSYDYNCDQDWDWEDEEPYLLARGSSSDDDTENFPFTVNDRFIDSGWGGECLREIEDIDFEFVYALHTFVATVEGQANATKGDTMVLLDDSNSYWWLVRVVKDGSIGYLPAEHIETPTERLARLNKHRNIDLSASMLGDNPEKSKNPLKKAMRRRNAKTVQFTAPTYYEPSDYEYSDEEEEGDDSQLDQLGTEEPADEADGADDPQDASSVEREQQAQRKETTNGIQRVTSNESLKSSSSASPVKGQSAEIINEQTKVEEPVSRSRKGVVRNTDSFFRDDTAETKKISLTPRLLRSDADSSASGEQEVRQRPSLDTFDKLVGSDEKTKDKKKEKKGMLSGFFKRSKKGTVPEESERTSEDSRQSPQSKESLESLTARPEPGPERRPSKLQKAPPSTSPKASPTEAKNPYGISALTPQSGAPPAPTGPAPAPPTSTVRKVDNAIGPTEDQYTSAPLQSQPPAQVNRFPSLTEKRSMFSPITTALKSTAPSTADASSPIQTIYSKRSKERFAIDNSGSDDDEGGPKPGADHQGQNTISAVAGIVDTNLRQEPSRQVPAAESSQSDKLGDQRPYILQTTTDSSQGPPYIETNVADSEGTASTSKASPSTATHTPSTSRSTPTWSDASLRSYMENDQDIKDLLIIVHDKSNVTPVGPDHPFISNLFADERNKLAEMQIQLDSMLMSWMSKKNSNLVSTPG